MYKKKLQKMFFKIFYISYNFFAYHLDSPEKAYYIVIKSFKLK